MLFHDLFLFIHLCLIFFFFFFFNDTATTEIYTLSLHDALPISPLAAATPSFSTSAPWNAVTTFQSIGLRSEEHTSELSHVEISYAVFCLKKKKKKKYKNKHNNTLHKHKTRHYSNSKQ